MTGTPSDAYLSGHLLNSANQQTGGTGSYQLFYDGWPHLSKKAKRRLAYAAVLQSTAKMASALSTCSQANAQYVDTIKRQEELISAMEGKEGKTRLDKSGHCDEGTSGTGGTYKFEKYEGQACMTVEPKPVPPPPDTANTTACSACHREYLLTQDASRKSDIIGRLKFQISEMEKERHMIINEFENLKRQLGQTLKDLEREKGHSAQLCKQIESQQADYVTLQNQRVASNQEQLRVIEYLQNEVKKGAAQLAELKTDVAALHAEKNNLLSYMSQRLNMAQDHADRWRTLQNTCEQTIRNVADIPHVVHNVQDDIKKLQTQMEIQRQRTAISSVNLGLQQTVDRQDTAQPTTSGPNVKDAKKKKKIDKSSNCLYYCDCINCSYGLLKTCRYSKNNLEKSEMSNGEKIYKTIDLNPTFDFQPTTSVSLYNNTDWSRFMLDCQNSQSEGILNMRSFSNCLYTNSYQNLLKPTSIAMTGTPSDAYLSETTERNHLTPRVNYLQ